MNNLATETILSWLDAHKIPYRAYAHEKTDDLEEKQKNDRENGCAGAVHCKNLVLVNRANTKVYLLSMAYGKRFRTGPVSRAMGSGRLNFAGAEVLQSLLCAESGMVSPLELIFDKGLTIRFFMDRDLENAAAFAFHPASESMTVVLSRDDFFDKFLPALGRAPAFVTFPDNEEEL